MIEQADRLGFPLILLPERRRLRRHPQPGAHRHPQPAGRDPRPYRGGAPGAGPDRAGRGRAAGGHRRGGRAARRRRGGRSTAPGTSSPRGPPDECRAGDGRGCGSRPRRAYLVAAGARGDLRGAGADGALRGRAGRRGRAPPRADRRLQPHRHAPRQRHRHPGARRDRRRARDHQAGGGHRRREQIPRRLPARRAHRAGRAAGGRAGARVRLGPGAPGDRARRRDRPGRPRSDRPGPAAGRLEVGGAPARPARRGRGFSHEVVAIVGAAWTPTRRQGPRHALRRPSPPARSPPA